MPSRISHSEEETRRLGRGIGEALRPDGVLLLSGDLGSGKTVLARGVAEALGIRPEEVVSPTYTLIHELEGPGGRLIHVDLYRLEPAQVEAIGLGELLEGPGVKVVEWAERLPFTPPGALALTLERGPGAGRTLRRVAGPDLGLDL
ncbi:MAG TPA: tRNA (adenosine(37)-N6)-threonylcarbamoyltransferase complex ATPase subunit type 1 TsaE [Thermoanaerobaculia bacterium]|nr:tRNA (adenosine(37)-N6)-threonylcarbamoyltransferase complex ATPase subunit type 1 TsaE [Thermoanaerobaculia bacterium]